MTNKLPKYSLEILDQAKSGLFPDSLPYSEKEKISAIDYLISNQYLSGKAEKVYGATVYINITITPKGYSEIEQNTFLKRLKSAINNVFYGSWKFILGIVSAVLVAILLKLIG